MNPEEPRCEVRTASDGTKVRVHGSISQEQLDELTEKVRAFADSRCKVESTTPMPAVAQRMHGRENYICGREQGHEGLHRWPDRGDGSAITEWGDA